MIKKTLNEDINKNFLLIGNFEFLIQNFIIFRAIKLFIFVQKFLIKKNKNECIFFYLNVMIDHIIT